MSNLNKNSSKSKFGYYVFFIFLIFSLLILIFDTKNKNEENISYSDFLTKVTEKKISEVYITDNQEISGYFIGSNNRGVKFSTVIPYFDSTLIDFLEKNEVVIVGEKSSVGFMYYLQSFLPWIMFIFLFVFIARQNAAQNSRGFQFGKSPARLFEPKSNLVTFKDVAGQDEAKEDLAEIVDYLKNPDKYISMGAKIPKGVLLVGNPGTGKTLLARAVAGEADVSFLHISGSDFVEMFVGVGASRVRDLFEQGRKMAPCIIFIDEIDAVGRARGAGLGGGHDEREQTLNQLLVEMDGFENKSGIIVLAATNRPDVLDAALLRPGRFDRQVTVNLPDIKEREAILNVHASKIKTDESVDLSKLARGTPGMSGADLANILNEAALFASRKNIKAVTSVEIEEARDKVLMGTARKSVVIPENEKLMTAYHEAGHALQYYFLKNADPLHKVTVIPRGRALGVTIGLPEEDTYCHTKEWLLDRLVIFYGGYSAEQLVYGTTTTGTSNDIQRATDIARKMVCEWGMSEKVGVVSFGQEDEPIFMGRDIARHKSFSEETAAKIDEAVKEILVNAKNQAYKNLENHRNFLDTLAKALVKNETLSDEDIRALPGFEEL
jgi:cell division protease FtsH